MNILQHKINFQSNAITVFFFFFNSSYLSTPIIIFTWPTIYLGNSLYIGRFHFLQNSGEGGIVPTSWPSSQSLDQILRASPANLEICASMSSCASNRGRLDLFRPLLTYMGAFRGAHRRRSKAGHDCQTSVLV